MKLELTPDEARVFLGYIDTTLKAKGIEALDSAWLFKSKIQEAAQKEQHDKTALFPPHVPAPADSASQLG